MPRAWYDTLVRRANRTVNAGIAGVRGGAALLPGQDRARRGEFTLLPFSTPGCASQPTCFLFQSSLGGGGGGLLRTSVLLVSTAHE